MDTRVCLKCKQELPLSAFEVNKRWVRNVCKECRKAQKNQYNKDRYAPPPPKAERQVVDKDEAYEHCLWSIVGQAVEDATRQTEVWTRDSDCNWSPEEAMGWLEKMFGPEHRIVKGTKQMREKGRHVRVNLHDQDKMKEAK